MATNTIRYSVMQKLQVPGGPVLGKADAATFEAHEAMLLTILRGFQQRNDGATAALVEGCLSQLRLANENPGVPYFCKTLNAELVLISFDLSREDVESVNGTWASEAEIGLTRIFLGLDAN